MARRRCDRAGRRMSETLDALVLRLVIERGAGKTICPTEAAKASGVAPEEAMWGARIKAVRAVAVSLAKRGEVSIYRKGKPVDPEGFKGVYRIGLPPEGPAD
ncbi:hypothetical protein GCM10008179_30290 [Hansschlegelia plantiphila]|uniref:DUF3253 domain-containing protein n=2 Tax=Hansschlegelia plantiphila TaxID=374655 RepID=A0A9W6J230_9HYPH|nr:hypothetical protein GCM10008179_30290 [Hansschlegelia plantiphila]